MKRYLNLKEFVCLKKKTTQVILTNPDLLMDVTTTIGRISLHPSQYEKKPRFPTIESLPDEFYVLQRSPFEVIKLINSSLEYDNITKERSDSTVFTSGGYAFIKFKKRGNLINSCFLKNSLNCYLKIQPRGITFDTKPEDILKPEAFKLIEGKVLLSGREFYELFKDGKISDFNPR